MRDEISLGGVAEAQQEPGGARPLLPLRVGSAVVYVQQTGEPIVAPAGEVHTVTTLSPAAAFETASQFLQECVRVMGERLEALKEHRPHDLEVEFSLTFKVAGKAQLIPVFVTGETSTESGIKVKAVWRKEGSPA